jgi:hypothetical protein
MLEPITKKNKNNSIEQLVKLNLTGKNEHFVKSSLRMRMNMAPKGAVPTKKRGKN